MDIYFFFFFLVAVEAGAPFQPLRQPSASDFVTGVSGGTEPSLLKAALGPMS